MRGLFGTAPRRAAAARYTDRMEWRPSDPVDPRPEIIYDDPEPSGAHFMLAAGFALALVAAVILGGIYFIKSVPASEPLYAGPTQEEINKQIDSRADQKFKAWQTDQELKDKDKTIATDKETIAGLNHKAEELSKPKAAPAAPQPSAAEPQGEPSPPAAPAAAPSAPTYQSWLPPTPASGLEWRNAQAGTSVCEPPRRRTIANRQWVKDHWHVTFGCQ